MGTLTRGGGWTRRRFLAGGMASATLALLSACAGRTPPQPPATPSSPAAPAPPETPRPAAPAAAGQSAPSPGPAQAATSARPAQAAKPAAPPRPSTVAKPAVASPAPQAAPASGGGPVTLTWMTPADVGQERDFFTGFARSFEQQHPGIKLAISFEGRADYETRLSAALASAAVPDVIQLHASSVQDYGLPGLLRDLFPYLKRDTTFQDAFFPFLIEQLSDFKTRSRLWAVPMDSAIYAVYYNKESFDRAGVAYPRMDWSFAEFRETAARLTQDKQGNAATSDRFDPSSIAHWGLTWGNPLTDSPLPGSDLWQMVAWGQAGPWFSDDLKQAYIDDPAHIDFVRQVIEMRCRDHSIPQSNGAPDQGDPWRKGLVAMSFAQHSQTYFYKQEKHEFPFDVVAAPGGPRGQFTAASCSGWAIPTAARHPDEAWAFIRHLVSPAQQTPMAQAKRWGASIKESELHLLPEDNIPASFKPVFLDPMLGQSPVPVRPIVYPPYLEEMRLIWKAEFGDLFSCGIGTVGEAARRAQPRIQALLDRAWTA